MYEWWLSVLCEEFHCRPSEAIEEWRRAPIGLLETIVECRAFAAAYHVVQRAATPADIPKTPLTALVQEIELDLAAEEIEKDES